MSRLLPINLQGLILPYLPLTKIERHNLAKNLLIQLVYFRYNVLEREVTLPANLSLVYQKIAVFHGDIGKLGHLVTDVLNCCILAIQCHNFDLLKYYLYMLNLPDDETLEILLATAITSLDNNITSKYCTVSIMLLSPLSC